MDAVDNSRVQVVLSNRAPQHGRAQAAGAGEAGRGDHAGFVRKLLVSLNWTPPPLPNARGIEPRADSTVEEETVASHWESALREAASSTKAADSQSAVNRQKKCHAICAVN